MQTKFKVGDTVRCVSSRHSYITLGRTYVIKDIQGEWYRVITDHGGLDGYREKAFELVEPNPVLTPEEVLQYFKEKRQDELECIQPNGLVLNNMTEYTGIKYIFEYTWRIKPEPEVIELNGKRYKLIEE